MTTLDARRRPAVAALLTLMLAVAPLGCKRKHAGVRTIEELPALATVVHMADPQTAPQLLSGFYGVEGNAWRWTAGRFAVVLRPPRSAAQNGATLELKFTIPDVVIAKLQAISLSASVNGAPLTPEKYTQAGQFSYSREVAASLLNHDTVRVDFVLDKSLPPSAGDQRELGVVASSVGLEPR